MSGGSGYYVTVSRQVHAPGSLRTCEDEDLCPRWMLPPTCLSSLTTSPPHHSQYWSAIKEASSVLSNGYCQFKAFHHSLCFVTRHSLCQHTKTHLLAAPRDKLKTRLMMMAAIHYRLLLPALLALFAGADSCDAGERLERTISEKTTRWKARR